VDKSKKKKKKKKKKASRNYLWTNLNLGSKSSPIQQDWRDLQLMAKMALGDPRAIKGIVVPLKK
jgi:hypothetical protein